MKVIFFISLVMTVSVITSCSDKDQDTDNVVLSTDLEVIGDWSEQNTLTDEMSLSGSTSSKIMPQRRGIAFSDSVANIPEGTDRITISAYIYSLAQNAKPAIVLEERTSKPGPDMKIEQHLVFFTNEYYDIQPETWTKVQGSFDFTSDFNPGNLYHISFNNAGEEPFYLDNMRIVYKDEISEEDQD